MNDLITSGTTSVNDCFVQLTPEIIDFKVGLFNSRTRLGRVGQALGSRALPGDTSGLRHPVRSTAYQGLTPGGGGNNRLGRRVGGPQKFVRCPVGFEFGGRFAGRNFDNCGRSVFTLPIEGIPSGITNPLAGAVPNFTAVLPNAPRGTVQQIVSQITDAHAIQVMRNASIPKLGASNKNKADRALAVAAEAVSGKGKASSLFVRRDGITLSPTMSITEMGKLRNNPDMVGGTFVSRLSEPASMGKDDIPVLLRSSLGGISYGFAGGARIDIVKKRDLSPSEARRLTGVFNRAQATQDNYIYDAALIALKEASGNAIEYTGYFPGVPRPYEQITVTNKDGQTRLVPRWVYHIFLAASAPQRGSGGSWTIVQSAIAKLNPKQKIKSLDAGLLVNQNKQNLIEFKTISFISENDFSRYAFEAKTVAAVWDDKLPPSGGFRCPPGTRYGGRITDRFGRNCGWNVSRRLANQLQNIGGNVGERLDDRRDRRVGRRVERRLGRAERGVGRAERRLEGAQQRLNNLRGGDANVGTSRRSRRVRRGAGRVEGVAQRLDDFADRRDRGERRKRRGSRTDRVEGVAQRLDDFADRRDRGVRRERRERRGDRTDRLDARAKRREERQARRLERRQRRDERVGRAASRLDNFADRRDGISRTDRNNARREVTNDRAPRIPDQGMRPRPGNGLPRIPDQGFDREPRPDVPRWEPRPDRPRPDRPNDRRPSPDLPNIPDQGFDREPRPNRPRPDRPNDRVPSRKPSGRGERVVSDVIKPSAADMRNVRNRFRQNGLPDSPFWRDGEDNERNRELARRFDRYYDEDGNLTALGEAINARLADESARPPRQPRQPRRPRPAVPDVIKPSAADMRNVRNQFQQNGLPDSPFWRDGEDNERNRELARRFDRYYDEDGNLTALGEAINARLADESARPPRQPRQPRRPRPDPSVRPDPFVRPNDPPNLEPAQSKNTIELFKAYDDRREAFDNLGFDERLKGIADDALEGTMYNLFEEINNLKDQPFEVQNLNDLRERFGRAAEEVNRRIQDVDGNNIVDHNTRIAHLQAIQEIDQRLNEIKNDLNNVLDPVDLQKEIDQAREDYQDAIRNGNLTPEQIESLNNLAQQKMTDLLDEIGSSKDLNNLKERYRREVEYLRSADVIPRRNKQGILLHLLAIQEIDQLLEDSSLDDWNQAAEQLNDLARFIEDPEMVKVYDQINIKEYQEKLQREVGLIDNYRGLPQEARQLQSLLQDNINVINELDNALALNPPPPLQASLLIRKMAKIEANKLINKRLAEIDAVNNVFSPSVARQLNANDLQARAGHLAKRDAIRNNIREMDQEIRNAENEIDFVRNLPDMNDPYQMMERKNKIARLRDHVEKLNERKAERIAENQLRGEQNASRLQSEAAEGVQDAIGDPAKVFAERYEAVNERRRKILSNYLRKRYGDTDKPWLNPDYNIDELKRLKRSANRGTPEQKLIAKQKLQDWAEGAYGHSELIGQNGLKYRTIIDPVNTDHGEIGISGEVEIFNEATGAWQNVGSFGRHLNLETKSVSNGTLFLRDVKDANGRTLIEVKNGGFQTIFNPHAWTWAQAAGFKQVEVGAVQDGVYVWGRVGFRADRDKDYRNLADKFDIEIEKFIRNDPSIIKNAQDAEIIKMLVQKSKAVNHNKDISPSHGDYIAALSNGDKDYEKELITWFKGNVPFNHGVLEFDDKPYIADDIRSAIAPVGDFVPPSLAVASQPRELGKSQFANVDDAIRHLHAKDENGRLIGGSLADIPDGVVLEAVLDDNIRGISGVNALLFDRANRQSIMLNGPTRSGVIRPPGGWDTTMPGGKFENDRFTFENIKKGPIPMEYGVWEVLKVKDKLTGETWYMKTSQYGLNDGLLENIGMNIAQDLGFGNNDNHLRLGEVIVGNNGKPMRWMMMRDVGQWEQGRVPIVGDMVDAAEFTGDLSKIVPEDAARMAVMDFIFDNTDRHAKNFLLGTDDLGRVRIGIIDNGLIGGGRTRAGERVFASERDIQDWAAMAMNETVDGYSSSNTNNGIRGLKYGAYFAHQSDEEREKFASQAEKSIKKIEEQLDQILSIQRIEKNGVKLTDIEKAHIEAIRQVATARIEYMKNGGGLAALVSKF